MTKKPKSGTGPCRGASEGESLRADFECAMSEGKTGERMFIACFDDGRLLLASTDRTSFEEICAARETR
jgi:hypothetical protein